MMATGSPRVACRHRDQLGLEPQLRAALEQYFHRVLDVEGRTQGERRQRFRR